MRLFPFNGSNGVGQFDPLTGIVVFPLVIKDGNISNETLQFMGSNKSGNIDHQLGEMISIMGEKSFIKNTDGNKTILDCSGLFDDARFQQIKNIQNFSGYVSLNLKETQQADPSKPAFHFFEEIENAQEFIWTWTPQSVDKFEFHSEGRHPLSTHKIFAEVMQDGGFFFTQIFPQETTAIFTVENFTKGIIGRMKMNTFVGEPGRKTHRGEKMLGDAASYVLPWLWENNNIFEIKKGVNHRFKSIQMVCPIIQRWSKDWGNISNPIMLKLTRGRGEKHTDEVTVQITHQKVIFE